MSLRILDSRGSRPTHMLNLASLGCAAQESQWGGKGVGEPKHQNSITLLRSARCKEFWTLVTQ